MQYIVDKWKLELQFFIFNCLTVMVQLHSLRLYYKYVHSQPYY
jgi:hypothetical protein